MLNKPCKPIGSHKFMESFRFLDMNKVIGTELCLPNCGGTEYTTSISTAPFRRCDQSNLGLTEFCSIGATIMKPQKWAELVLKDYLAVSTDGTLPGKLKKSLSDEFKIIHLFFTDYLHFLDSPMRQYPDDQFFKEGYENSAKYNAYLEDIAAVRFYFNRPTAMELVSAPR